MYAYIFLNLIEEAKIVKLKVNITNNPITLFYIYVYNIYTIIYIVV